MSAYTEQTIQDAKRKSIQEGRGLVGFAEHFLAALVPDGSEAVIVLRGGEVVGLEKVVSRWNPMHRIDVCCDLLDAARQVAEEEA